MRRTLELNDLTEVLVLHDGTVAGELLLDDLQDLLLVEALGETLDGGEGLAAIALLDADVDVVLAFLGIVVALALFGISEGVDCLEVFDGSHQRRVSRVAFGLGI